MEIVLVRHSRTVIAPEVNSMLWTLSDEGRETAAKIAQDPIFEGCALIYSSLQPKAIETAEIIGEALQISAFKEEGLAELSSVTSGFIEDYIGTVHRLYAGEIPNINGGETLKDALTRFNKAIEMIASRHANLGKIAIVSHANVLSLFTAQHSNLEAYDLHNSIAMPDAALLSWDGVNPTIKQSWGNVSI